MNQSDACLVSFIGHFHCQSHLPPYYSSICLQSDPCLDSTERHSSSSLFLRIEELHKGSDGETTNSPNGSRLNCWGNHLQLRYSSGEAGGLRNRDSACTETRSSLQVHPQTGNFAILGLLSRTPLRGACIRALSLRTCKKQESYCSWRRLFNIQILRCVGTGIGTSLSAQAGSIYITLLWRKIFDTAKEIQYRPVLYRTVTQFASQALLLRIRSQSRPSSAQLRPS